jgi:3-oxoacyl-[acyl-carrier protein] reductase
VKSAFLVTKEVVPHMTNGGAIINFSSQAARDGGGFGALAYASAKGAILTMTKGLAKELGPKGIRVNCVSPGMINTTFHNTFTKDEVRKNVAAATPLRREGEASEVGDLVLYLASSSSSFVTGASIEINGGTYFV